MANGFQYESPLNRLLSVTVPRFLDRQLEREQQERMSDKAFNYRQEQDALAREDKIRQENEESKRYSALLIEAEDDEQYQRDASTFEDTRILYTSVDRQLKAFENIDLSKLHPDVATRITSHIGGLKESVADVTTKMSQFDSNKVYSVVDRERIQASFMQGKDGYAVADQILRDRYSAPYTQVQSSIIGRELTVLSKEMSDARKNLSVTSDEKQIKIIESNINDIQSRINSKEAQLDRLYDQDRPFNPNIYRTQFQKKLFERFKTEGLNIDEIGRDNLNKKYGKEITAHLQKYGIEGAEYSQAERDSAEKVLEDYIIEQEKTQPPGPEPGFQFEDLIPGVGTLGAGFVGWRITEKPRKFLAEKAGQAGRYVKWVAKELPNEDIGKFLETVSKKTPGQVGTMMPKVEKLISEIDEVTLEGENWRGPKGERGYKKQIARLNAKLDKQVEKIKKTLRKSKGVSSKLTDANLEKLIRNPNKWFLPKVKAKMFSMKASSGKMARAWGGFRIAQEVGKALGDETGGVATGLGATGSWKLAKKIYKKKGPKWMAQKLTPIIGNTLTKRVMQGAVSGTVLPGWGNLIGTVLGAGFAVKDVAEALGMIGQEIESDEPVIGSLGLSGPPDSLSFMTPAK